MPRRALITALVLPGDFDNDGDIDQSDFGHLQDCIGADVTHIPACEDADLHTDGDVDNLDGDAFRQCMGGPNQPPGC